EISVAPAELSKANAPFIGVAFRNGSQSRLRKITSPACAVKEKNIHVQRGSRASERARKEVIRRGICLTDRVVRLKLRGSRAGGRVHDCIQAGRLRSLRGRRGAVGVGIFSKKNLAPAWWGPRNVF